MMESNGDKLPQDLVDFLHVNPFPSMSYLPMSGDDGERLLFFLQDAAENLAELGGTVPMIPKFYMQNDQVIFCMSFLPTRPIRAGTPYYETIFDTTDPLHITALKLLLRQDTFEMVLYDRHSGYTYSKRFTFGQQAVLRELLHQRGLL